jgi:hypothetical protein
MAETRQIGRFRIHLLGDGAAQLAKSFDASLSGSQSFGDAMIDLREPTSRVPFYRGARASRGLLLRTSAWALSTRNSIPAKLTQVRLTAGASKLPTIERKAQSAASRCQVRWRRLAANIRTATKLNGRRSLL